MGVFENRKGRLLDADGLVLIKGTSSILCRTAAWEFKEDNPYLIR